MKPEQEAAIKAANARLKAAQDRLDALKASKEAAAVAATKTAAETVTVGAISPEVAAKIETLEKSVRDLESANRARPNTAEVKKVEVKEVDAKHFSLVKFLRAVSPVHVGGMGLHIFDAKGWEGSENELSVARRGWMDKHTPGAGTWGEANAIAKAMSFQDTASAGGIVPVALMSEIIGLNRSMDVLPKLGVTVKSGLTGNVEWNRRISGTTFRPIAENPSSSPTVDDLAYTKIQLTPREFVGFCKLSNKLRNQAGSVIEAEVRDDLGGAWVESRNSNLLAGTGVGGYPLGIINRDTGSGQSLMNTESFSGAALAAAWPKLWNMRALIRADKNDVGGLKFAMHPNDWSDICRGGAASTTSAAAGTAYPPLFNAGDPSKGVAPMLIGFPVVECDELTEGTILLGDFSQVFWGEWTGVGLAMSDTAGTSFEYNQTWVRMIYDCDVAVAKPSALCTGTTFSV